MAFHRLPESRLRHAQKGGTHDSARKRRNRRRFESRKKGSRWRNLPDGWKPAEEPARGGLSEVSVRSQLQGNQRGHEVVGRQRRFADPHGPESDSQASPFRTCKEKPMTRINPDDPKWTAYVLGALDNTDLR